MVLSLSCRDSARLLSEGLERPLSRMERAGLRVHLLLCWRCRRFRRALRLLREAVRHMGNRPRADGDGHGLDREQRARLVRTLRRVGFEKFR